MRVSHLCDSIIAIYRFASRVFQALFEYAVTFRAMDMAMREHLESQIIMTAYGINLIDALQWPAMVVTVLASWLVASSQSSRRNVGFWVFIGSNVLWIAWGVYSAAPALVTLQVCLAAMNIRGARKTENK